MVRGETSINHLICPRKVIRPLWEKLKQLFHSTYRKQTKHLESTKLNQFKNWRRKITILIRKTDKHLNNLDSSSAYTESLLFSPLLYCPTDHGLGLSQKHPKMQKVASLCYGLSHLGFQATNERNNPNKKIFTLFMAPLKNNRTW